MNNCGTCAYWSNEKSFLMRHIADKPDDTQRACLMTQVDDDGKPPVDEPAFVPITEFGDCAIVLTSRYSGCKLYKFTE